MLNKPDHDFLMDFFKDIKQSTDDMLGYPVSKDFDYHELFGLLNYPINNLGDPFVNSTWKIDSRVFERTVMSFFADLYHAPQDNWWGYVTNGGTEGNLYGLYLAREMYPRGIVYCSDSSHYSVKKNLHLLNMPHVFVKSQPNGEIDYEEFKHAIRPYSSKPVIFFANIGTTMTEARDDISKIKSILNDCKVSEYYVHSDAAFAGGVIPFHSHKDPFDFADGADSISVSGHKSFGSPIPCGIVLARKDYVQRIAKEVAYVGSLDTTISGSRNGFTPIALWYRIQSLGLGGFAARVQSSENLVVQAIAQLRDHGIDAWRNRGALTIVLPTCSTEVKEKWQLASSNNISHIIVVPGTKEENLQMCINDVIADLA